jgi:deoxyribonuclease V
MIYCFDTYYGEDYAKTAVIGIEDYTAAEANFVLNDTINKVDDYESGAFYKRELPCLLSIIKKLHLDSTKDIFVIDGYVLLSDEGKPGLRGYLFEAFEGQIPVIGVAKNDFASLQKLKRSVYRGKSKKPLFVSALGYDLQEAGEHILKMHGAFRIPGILKLADQKCREYAK